MNARTSVWGTKATNKNIEIDSFFAKTMRWHKRKCQNGLFLFGVALAMLAVYSFCALCASLVSIVQVIPFRFSLVHRECFIEMFQCRLFKRTLCAMYVRIVCVYGECARFKHSTFNCMRTQECSNAYSICCRTHSFTTFNRLPIETKLRYHTKMNKVIQHRIQKRMN